MLHKERICCNLPPKEPTTERRAMFGEIEVLGTKRKECNHQVDDSQQTSRTKCTKSKEKIEYEEGGFFWPRRLSI